MAVLRIHSPVVGRHEQVFDWDLSPITLGRDETCEVVLLEQSASRRHARLEWMNGEARLSDCGSGNGTWVGADKVESRPLRDGEIFRIGETTIQLVLDPFSQPTMVGSDAAPAAEPPPSDTLATGDTMFAAPREPSRPTPAAEPPPPAPPQLPTSSPSAPYSLGEAPTLAGGGPSSPSVYSLGNEPNAPDPGPHDLGLPTASGPSVYSLGNEPNAPDPGPHDLGLPTASGPSVYSLGNEPSPPDPGPHDLGLPAASGPSVYSLGNEPSPPDPGPHDLGLPAASGPSVYSLGDAAPTTGRGPDVPVAGGLPSSSAELGMPPPAPPPMAAVAPPVAPAPAPVAPAAVPIPPIAQATPPMPPVVLPPPANAASSWRWAESSSRRERRSHGRPAGPMLWVGLVLFLGGLVAIIAALAVGYDPSTLLGMGAP